MASMAKVIERSEGRYEAHDEAYGKDYVWCPGCLLVECGCGERVALNTTATTCQCGADHTTLIETELASRKRSEAFSLPLHKECNEWRKKQGEYLRSESHDRLEWSALE